jgi:hypothetical protein
MTPFLAQITPPAGGIAGFLERLIPLGQFASIAEQVMLPFVLVAVFILTLGHMMAVFEHRTPFRPVVRFIVLFASVVASVWFMQVGQEITNSLLTAIGSAVPGNMNWLVVSNPSDATLALDFSKPFAVIAKYIYGAVPKSGAPTWWELDKWVDYILRAGCVIITAAVAFSAVVVMEIALIVQRLILIFSRPLLPVMIACLSLPAARGSAQNFLKFTLGVMAWPVGWGLTNLLTAVILQGLVPPAWNSPLDELILAVVQIVPVCIWMMFSARVVPFAVTKLVTSGSNFAGAMIGGYAGAVGQAAGNVAKAGAMVGGAAVGGALGGAAGVAVGTSVGSAVGGAAASPVASTTQSLEVAGAGETRHAAPSSRSAAAASAAVKAISARTA